MSFARKGKRAAIARELGGKKEMGNEWRTMSAAGEIKTDACVLAKRRRNASK